MRLDERTGKKSKGVDYEGVRNWYAYVGNGDIFKVFEFFRRADM